MGHSLLGCVVVLATVQSLVSSEGTAEKDENKVPLPPSDFHLFHESVTSNTVAFSFHPSTSKLCTGHTVTFTATNPKVKTKQVFDMGSSARFGTVSGLLAGREYRAELVANGDHGSSDPVTGKVLTKPSVPTGAPEELSAREKGSTWFVLTWSAPKLGAWGEEVESLTYDVHLDGETVLENTPGSSHNFTGLRPGGKYKVVVFARNSVGRCQDRHAGAISVTTLASAQDTTTSKHLEL